MHDHKDPKKPEPKNPAEPADEGGGPVTVPDPPG